MDGEMTLKLDKEPTFSPPKQSIRESGSKK